MLNITAKSIFVSFLIVILSSCAGVIQQGVQETPANQLNCKGDTKLLNFPSPPDEYVLDDVFKMLPSRKEKFNNTLAVSAVVSQVVHYPRKNGVREYTDINLFLYFRNISMSKLIVRKPLLPGIRGAIDESTYDLYFSLYSKDGSIVEAMNNYHYLEEDNVTQNDFVEIDEGGEYCLPVKLQVPVVFIENKETAQLPAGGYYLLMVYQNFMIGYHVPLLATPPPDISGYADEWEWYILNNKEADLNAWVGQTDPIRVEFEVSR